MISNKYTSRFPRSDWQSIFVLNEDGLQLSTYLFISFVRVCLCMCVVSSIIFANIHNTRSNATFVRTSWCYIWLGTALPTRFDECKSTKLIERGVSILCPSSQNSLSLSTSRMRRNATKNHTLTAHWLYIYCRKHKHSTTSILFLQLSDEVCWAT